MIFSNKEKTINTILFIIGISLFCICSYYIAKFLPYNMDEMIQFHRTACEEYPYAFYNSFRCNCTNPIMSLFGFTWHHSWEYVGSLNDMLFRPFFLTIKTIYSVAFYGISCLIVFSLLLTYSLKLSFKVFIIPLLYFPLFYSFLKDTGPIRIAFIFLPILILCYDNYINYDSNIIKKIFILVFCAVLCTIGVEDKAFFLYLLPMYLSIAICTAIKLNFVASIEKFKTNISNSTLFCSLSFNIRILNKNIKELFIEKYKKVVVLCSFCLLIPLLYLFFVKIDGRRYLFYLLSAKNSIPLSLQISAILKELFLPVFNSHRIFEHFSYISNILSFTVWLPLFSIMLKNIKQKISGVFLALIIEVIIFLIMRNTPCYHHLVFLHLPIIIYLMMISNSSNKVFFQILSILIISLSVNTTILVLNKHQGSHSEKSREVIFDYLSQKQIAETSIISFNSWGGYFIQSLFGDSNQLVTYNEPFLKTESEQLINIAKETERKHIIHVCNNCSISLYQDYYPKYKIEELSFDKTTWKIYDVKVD